MARIHASSKTEQRVVMKFLVNEGVKPSEIHRRLQVQYGDQTLSRSKTFEWCQRFKDGRKSVNDDLGRGGSVSTAVIPVNIQRVECLILNNRRITCRQIAEELNMSGGTVNTVIHKHLFFRKVSARWVPRQLSAFDRHRRLQICNDLKERFVTEGHNFLDRIVTCDETWVHHFTPESKRASKQWKHTESSPPKKFRRIASAGKVMASVFWDKSGIIHVDFLPRGININSDYYCQVIQDVHNALKKKRPGFITKSILFLQDNARPHTAHRTICKLQELSWEVLPHPPYSSDLAPSDFHLFGPLKEFLRGQYFSNDDEMKQAVRLWFRRTKKSFYAAGIQALVKRWNKCISVAGDYIEK